MNRLAEVSNWEVKRILEKIVKPSCKDWIERLKKALWAYMTTYKTPVGMSPFRLLYGKACYLPIEIEHKSYWAIKACDGDLESSLVQELEDMRLESYDNARIYKEKLKMIHDKQI
ncbi:uncharacterized protein LOC114745106 [Neltuma alba]|uniref:uncharacterized protein LOC114745106 n=1 Tax=Neltuma alba TaxID=207710 RepID=UPI0010A2EE66|nr:uncharacterized protein LOC114745106 [Prosopis alba]